LRQASPPRSPNASSKRGHFFSPDAGSNKRPPITPFKDECAAAAQHSITEVKQFSDAEQPNGPKKWTLEDFEIGKPLGRGKFGNVYAAKEKVSGVVVALKVMSKSPMLVEGAETSLQREVALHSRLVHPNILRMAGYFHNPKSCFIMLGECWVLKLISLTCCLV
jgi:serine/threonine protein kinase